MLTAREIEVLQAITNGLNNAEVAEQLHLSVETVKSHSKAILLKLGARDRTQAVVLGLQAGLVKMPEG
jgi:DNA-binding NarL/FixJ family response regulator